MKQLYAILIAIPLAVGLIIIGCAQDESPSAPAVKYGLVEGSITEEFVIVPDTTEPDTSAPDTSEVETGDPVKGAIVMVDGTNISTYTDSAGWYRLEVPEGTVSITVYKEGFADKAISSIIVTADETTTVDFILVVGEGSVPNVPIAGMWMLTARFVDEEPTGVFLDWTMDFEDDSTGNLFFEGYKETFKWWLTGNLLRFRGGALTHDKICVLTGATLTMGTNEDGLVLTYVFTKMHSGIDDIDERLEGLWELATASYDGQDLPPDEMMDWAITFDIEGAGNMTLSDPTEGYQDSSKAFVWSTSEDQLFMIGQIYDYAMSGDTLSGDSLSGFEIEWNALTLAQQEAGTDKVFTFARWEEVEEDTIGYIDENLLGTWELIERIINDTLFVPDSLLPALTVTFNEDSTGEWNEDEVISPFSWTVFIDFTWINFVFPDSLERENETKDYFFIEDTLKMLYLIEETEYFDTFLPL